MPKPPALMPLNEADYEAIEAAVMETNRGRWFLAEYARRNRHADTSMLLKALDRIESTIRGERTLESVDRIRFDLVEMAKAIARTKAEIAAIKPDTEHDGKFGEASQELDSIVQSTETATSDILAAAEQIQEVAWTLREQGLGAEICDLVDAKATDIYTACSFQDLTGQRTRKVIQVLRYLEGRINAMIDIWGLEGTMAAEAAESAKAREGEAAFNAPPRHRFDLDQGDVDVVMGPAAAAGPDTESRADQPADADRFVGDPEPVEPPSAAPVPEPQPPVDARPAAGLTAYRAPAPMAESPATVPDAPAAAPPVASTPAPAPAPARSEPEPAKRPAPASDLLAPISALSPEEKIALFS